MYNRFVRQRTLVDESWGGIDVELTRRHELIPNLVETVRGYAAHEQATLDAVVRAREAATAHHADDPKSRERYEDALGGALADLLVRVEAYPELKASSHFLALQDELTNTEDRIAASRRFFNGNVRAYNTRVRTFPSNLVAAMFGFTARDFFELRDRAARTAPDVDLR
jgi:LemA protein